MTNTKAGETFPIPSMPTPGVASEIFPNAPEETTMPRVFWNPARDRILREKYAMVGPTSIASLLGTSCRSVVNRAHRLNLRAPYPKKRARPSFPPKSWTAAERLLAEALLDLF